jgi:hypothetical protein
VLRAEALKPEGCLKLEDLITARPPQQSDSDTIYIFLIMYINLSIFYSDGFVVPMAAFHGYKICLPSLDSVDSLDRLGQVGLSSNHETIELKFPEK